MSKREKTKVKITITVDEQLHEDAQKCGNVSKFFNTAGKIFKRTETFEKLVRQQPKG